METHRFHMGNVGSADKKQKQKQTNKEKCLYSFQQCNYKRVLHFSSFCNIFRHVSNAVVKQSPEHTCSDVFVRKLEIPF